MKALILSLVLVTLNTAFAAEPATQDDLFLSCHVQPLNETGGPLYANEKLVSIDGVTKEGKFADQPTWKVLVSLIDVKADKFLVYASVGSEAVGANLNVSVLDNPNQLDLKTLLYGNAKQEILQEITTFGIPKKGFQQHFSVKGKKYYMYCKTTAAQDD